MKNKIYLIIGVIFSLIFLLNFVSATSCYQESANVSTVCGGLDTGIYDKGGSFSPTHPWHMLIDGDWDTYTTEAGLMYVYMNYSVPTGTLNSSLLQIYHYTLTPTNYSLSAGCLNTTTLQIRFTGHGEAAPWNGIWDCYNWGSWYEILNVGGNPTAYEEAMIWNISAGDTIYPVFSNNLTTPLNGTEYIENAKYEFNITIKDSNGTTGIDFNNVNYSLTNISSVFNKTFSNLGVGIYNYYYWAYGNGTTHLYNKSSVYSYTIIKNSSLVLGLTATTPIVYPVTTDFTTSGCPTQLTCNLNLSNIIYGAGSISGNYSTAGNANYSVTSATFKVTINKNSTYVLGIIGTTPINFGTATDVVGSGCPAEITCAFNISNGIYEVGITNFNYSTAGNTNYSVNSVIKAITINQVTGVINVQQCLYKKLGYWNNNLVWREQENCI